jgi:putative transposase
MTDQPDSKDHALRQAAQRKGGDSAPQYMGWAHSPVHRLVGRGTFIVTGATLGKAMHFSGASRLEFLHQALLTLADEFHWRLDAWAVFPNHWHIVAHAPVEGALTLTAFVSKLHGTTARWVNREDATPGRKVWHNYWDTRIDHQPSYLARLNYVHQNAVKHGLVNDARLYPWCSAAWLEKVASPAFVKTLASFDYRKVSVLDDYDLADMGPWMEQLGCLNTSRQAARGEGGDRSPHSMECAGLPAPEPSRPAAEKSTSCHE